MLRYCIVSVITGVLFGIMDGAIHANPLAQQVYRVFEPIARASISIPAGFAIDIVFGFAMAGIYLLIYPGLPGEGLLKGLGFGVLAWFFRVVMQAASQWMMFKVPAATLAYGLIVGLIEMLLLGLLLGVALKPSAA